MILLYDHTWLLISSALNVTDTPTVGWRSGGTDCRWGLTRFGGCRMKAPSIVAECLVRSALLFIKPARLTSVLPRDWFPQQRWICAQNTCDITSCTFITRYHVINQPGLSLIISFTWRQGCWLRKSRRTRSLLRTRTDARSGSKFGLMRFWNGSLVTSFPSRV